MTMGNLCCCIPLGWCIARDGETWYYLFFFWLACSSLMLQWSLTGCIYPYFDDLSLKQRHYVLHHPGNLFDSLRRWKIQNSNIILEFTQKDLD